MIEREALGRLEQVVDHSGVAEVIEERLPVGVRPRQLSVRSLILGIFLAICDERPAQLTRVHRALVDLAYDVRLRLGVEVEWRSGPHLLTYRQVERTFSLVVAALRAEDRAAPSLLQQVVDAIVEASIPPGAGSAASSYAVDWTDVESFSARQPTKGVYADPDARWGHRRGGGPGGRDELFFGYYLQVATMVADEAGPPVAELARRMALSPCDVDQPPLMVGVLADMAASGVLIGDVLCDSGYAHRRAANWALPLRRLGAELVMDLHPHDRGTRGSFKGAVCHNGSLYCPKTPAALFELGPLSRKASEAETVVHDARSAELSRYKLGRASRNDADGFHRVMCPAALGKLRCGLRESSMTLSYEHPEVVSPPDHPPACCVQLTITVPPEVNAKTAQKHDYPSRAHRESFARRTAVERTYATIKDPATTDLSRGWCRVMGLVPMSVLISCLLVVRNLRVADAFERRQAEDARRQAKGQGPATRRRRRRTIDDLLGAPAVPP